MNTITSPESTETSVNSKGLRTDLAPMDGTWIESWNENGCRIIQYDSTAFGGKGGWFNQKGHATKGPDLLFGWKPYQK